MISKESKRRRIPCVQVFQHSAVLITLYITYRAVLEGKSVYAGNMTKLVTPPEATEEAEGRDQMRFPCEQHTAHLFWVPVLISVATVKSISV